MKIHSLLIYAAVLIIVGCAGHGSPPVTPDLPKDPIAVAKADPNPGAINFPVNFSGSDSYDPDGGDLQLFEWDWNNDGTYDETGEKVDHTWDETGTYYVQLRVTDDEGDTDILDEPLSVEIGMMNPVAFAEADPNPQGLYIPVNFSGSDSYDPDGGDIQLFEWDWNNDGIYDETGENVDHTWSELGTFSVQLRVTDDENRIDILDEPLQVVISGAGEGNLIWAKRAGGPTEGYFDELGNAITALSDNSTVVTGRFFESATFGEGTPNQTVLVSDGGNDIFIARYNVDGTLAWAKRAGGPSDSSNNYEGNAITALSDNSTVVTGHFRDSATFGPGEPSETVLFASDEFDHDIFIARYNPDGTLDWAKRAGGASNDQGYAITTLSDNSTVVTGRFQDSAIFGPGESSETVLTEAGNKGDIFIARYNPDGTLAWAKRAGGGDGYAGSDCGYGITTLSDNSTVVTGHFDISATFGSNEPNQTVLTSEGGNDIFIARYNPDGTLAWAKCAGGPYSHDVGYGITALSDDSTVVTGNYYIKATFGQGESNVTWLGSAGGFNIFVARYNPDGKLVWVKQAGGASSEIGYGITTLSDNSTVITGYFYDWAIFGPDEPNQTFLTSAGSSDMFIARYNQDGTLAWAKHAGGVNYDLSNGITALSDDSTVVTGGFVAYAYFGLGESNLTFLTSDGYRDIFIARFEP